MSTAGPTQGAQAPLGGSDAHTTTRAAVERGGSFAAGPPQGETRPPRGAATRAAVERGGKKITRRPVHGVLLLDKPLGWSSNDALQKVKWLLRAEKAGHTGTLDPLATGVLPLCFGAATKFSQMQLDADKEYEATALLGSKTSTGDAEGEVIAVRPVRVDADDVARVVPLFTGPIRQTPPMHSALKKDGKSLYEYARAGIEVEREARSVTIHKLDVALAPVDTAQAAINMVVKCSKGTYIRTLGEDIGEALGCGAHLTRLRRTATGGFTQTQCVTLAALEAMTEDERMACLLPVDALLERHTAVTLDSDNTARFLSGVRRRGSWPDEEKVAVYSATPHALLGTARAQAGELIPGRLLSPLEITQSQTQQATTGNQEPGGAPQASGTTTDSREKVNHDQ